MSTDLAPARLRAARAYAQMTQVQLADQLGVNVKTVKRREAGVLGTKRGDLIATAAICDVPVEFLEHGFTPPPRGNSL